MRERLLIVLLTAAVGTCSRPSPPASGAATPPTAAKGFSSEIPIISHDLVDLLALRKEYADQIEVEPLLKEMTSAEQIRSALKKNQDLVTRAIAGSRTLSGVIPPRPEFTDDEVQANKHMDTPDSRLLQAARLLAADATRCWEIKDADGCAQRLAASLRIAEFVLSQPDDSHRLRGKTIWVAGILELAGRTDDGLLDRASTSARNDLIEVIKANDSSKLPLPSSGTPFDNAQERCRKALGVK